MRVPRYLTRLRDALRRNGSTVDLLDVPGFGGPGPLVARPTVHGIADAVAHHLLHRPDDGARVVLVGHSTGAQAALHAALAAQDAGRPPDALVLAGPTVAPGQRSVVRLVARAPLAYRRDPPSELVVVPAYLRAHRRAVTLLRSAVRDRPEEVAARLRVPLTLTAGVADIFAPADWLTTLADAAVAAPSVRVVRLPGSHNNPWTQPRRLARVVLTAR